MNIDRVEQLVHEALAQPQRLRNQYIERACGDDLALRREVESLLQHQKQASELFEASALEWTSVLSLVDETNRAATRDGDDVGMRIGPYRLTECIGSGGMGRVYRAVRDDDEFEHTVAVKLIRRGLDTEEVLDRFRQERQVLANLGHPNIAHLIDGGSTEDGRPYLLLEYVKGVRIDAYCDERRLTMNRRIELFRVVCDAVQFAHRNLVVHRDLKPGNILVVGDDSHPSVKLLDFGIAKVLAPDAGDAASPDLTAAMGPRLTLAYASPEQVARAVITTSSDVYSLGVILYELLVGCRPYAFDGLTHAEMETIIRERPPRPPREALDAEDAVAPDALDQIARARRTDVARLRRALRGDLETIMLRALHKEPDRRYTSVEAFSEDLGRYLRGLPVAARRDSTSYRIRRFIARHRVAVGAAAGVLLLLAAAAAVSTTLFLQAESARQLAESKVATAEAINLFLTDMLASVDPRNAGVDVTVRETLSEAAARVEIELAGFPDVQRSVHRTIGLAYLALGLYDEGHPHLDKALDLSVEVHGENDIEAAGAMNDLGLLLRQMGRYGEAERLHRRALEIHQIHLGEESDEAAGSMNDLAQVLYDQGHYDQGRPLYLKSLEIRSRAGELDHDFLATLNNLARDHLAAGDYGEAERVLREVLRLRTELSGESHLDTVGAMNNVAFITMSQGRYDEAEELFRQALEHYRDHYGEEHPDIARVLNNLGECLRRAGRLADAEAVHRQGLEMRRSMLDPSHPLVAVSLNNLGLTLAQRGELEEATAAHEESLSIRRAQFGETHPDVATSLGNLGDLLRRRGEYQRARLRLSEALEIRLGAFDEDHPLVANTKMNLARCLLELHDLEAAAALCSEALEAQEAKLEQGHPHTSASRALLGRILLRSGRLDDAEKLLLRAHEELRARLERDDAPQLRSIVEDLVSLYERAERSDEARKWREALANVAGAS